MDVHANVIYEKIFDKRLFHFKVDKFHFLSNKMPMIKKMTIFKLSKCTLGSTSRGTNRGVHSHFHAG